MRIVYNILAGVGVWSIGWYCWGKVSAVWEDLNR